MNEHQDKQNHRFLHLQGFVRSPGATWVTQIITWCFVKALFVPVSICRNTWVAFYNWNTRRVRTTHTSCFDGLLLLTDTYNEFSNWAVIIIIIIIDFQHLYIMLLVFNNTLSDVPQTALNCTLNYKVKPRAQCYAITCALLTGLFPPTQSSEVSHYRLNPGKCSGCYMTIVISLM